MLQQQGCIDFAGLTLQVGCCTRAAWLSTTAGPRKCPTLVTECRTGSLMGGVMQVEGVHCKHVAQPAVE